jgi:hypothetical protein
LKSSGWRVVVRGGVGVLDAMSSSTSCAQSNISDLRSLEEIATCVIHSSSELSKAEVSVESRGSARLGEDMLISSRDAVHAKCWEYRCYWKNYEITGNEKDKKKTGEHQTRRYRCAEMSSNVMKRLIQEE